LPIPTPFHPRTSALCTSLLWKEWAGYFAVRSYGTTHEPEYHAIRHAAGLLDVTPLFKYDVRGPDAAAFLSWVTVRDIAQLGVGRMTYLCWCDDAGKVVDDGTVARLDADEFRVTAAEPALAWLQRHARGFDVSIVESSQRLGALALQGPAAAKVLQRTTDADLSRLRYFGITRARLDGVPAWISRTGYTGDLGYEIWVQAEDALRAWDAVIDAGRGFCLQPMGLDALDVSRIEAGFILNGVDYHSAHLCPIESRKVSPYEVGLGWTVKLDREPFVGQAALKAELARAPRRALVGLAVDWDEFEAAFAAVGLPPQVPAAAWRTATPVYDRRGGQVGQATSGTWSPILKQNLAIATVRAEHSKPGMRLMLEVTVEYRRIPIHATVATTPFFDPERKRAVIDAGSQPPEARQEHPAGPAEPSLAAPKERKRVR
jgi:aminomethyltransferase